MNQVLKRIVVLITVLTVTNMIYAQGIAGPDKHIPLQQGEPDPVTLTASGDAQSCCFQWTTADGIILSAADQQSITIKPKSPKSTFHVTQVCSSGTVEDDVDVYYIDFDIVDVIPKNFCYPLARGVNLDDFIIITNPVGYENNVKVDWHNILAAINPIPIQEASIKFYEDYGNHSEKTVIITLVNESFGVTPTLETLDKIKEIREKLEEVIKTIESISELIKKIPKPASAGCEPVLDTGINIDGSDSFQCCESSISYPIKIVFSASGSIGIECKFPIGTFWGIFTAYANVGISGEGSVSSSFVLFKCEEDARMVFTLSPSASLSGGIEIVALSDKILSASASLIGRIEMNDLQFTLFPFTYGSFQTCAGIDVKLEAKAISLVKLKKQFTLYEGCWWSRK